MVVVIETETETAEFGTPQPPALPPCPSKLDVPLTKKLRVLFAASFPTPARVSMIRQGSSGMKLFSGVGWMVRAALTGVAGWASEPLLLEPPGAAPADAKPATPAATAIIRPRPILTCVFMYCSFERVTRDRTWSRAGDGAASRDERQPLSLSDGRGQHTASMVNDLP